MDQARRIGRRSLGCRRAGEQRSAQDPLTPFGRIGVCRCRWFGQEGRQIGRIGNGTAAGKIAADVEGRLAVDQRLALEQRMLRLAAGRIVMGQHAIRQIGPADGSAQGFGAEMVDRTDQRNFHRTGCQEIDDQQALGEGSWISPDVATVGAYRCRSSLTEVFPPVVGRQTGQGRRGHGIATRSRSVGTLAAPQDQRLMSQGSGKESAHLDIDKIGQHPFRQTHRFLQIPLIAAGLVNIDQSLRQIGIIFQIGVQVGLPSSIGAQQPSVGGRQRAQEKVRRPLRGFAVTRHAEHPCCFRHGPNHHAVPCRDDLVVQAWRHAGRPRSVQQRGHPCEGIVQFLSSNAQFVRHGLQRLWPVQDVLVFPVAVGRDVVIGAESSRVFLGGDRRSNLLRRPHEELAFHALGVRVGRRVIAAVRRGHLAQDVVQGFTGDAAIGLVAGDLVGLDIHVGEQRIVVEHLLEMGDQPPFVGGVSGKPAADLIVDAACGHGAQRGLDHGQGMAILRPLVTVEQQR